MSHTGGRACGNTIAHELLGGGDFPHLSRPALGTHLAFCTVVIGSFLGGKRPGRDHHPTPCTVEVKEKSYTSTPSLGLIGLFWAELYPLPTPVPDCKPTFLGKGELFFF